MATKSGPNTPMPSNMDPNMQHVNHGRAYTSEPQSGDLAAFTKTRPFHKCADCGWDLPESAGPLCSRCELARDHSQVSKRPFIADNDGDDNDSTYNI